MTSKNPDSTTTTTTNREMRMLLQVSVQDIYSPTEPRIVKNPSTILENQTRLLLSNL
jgi:hypothetical protein